MTPAIVLLDASGCAAHGGALIDLLVDAVDGGASVSFLPPLARADAEAFWANVQGGVASGSRLLLAAIDEGALVGAVQLDLATPPNQAHRADVAKLLVHRRARRRGIGRALMLALEREARARGRTLLTLDTRTGDAAEQLYVRLGYTRAGVIPRYAKSAGGALEATSLFWKEL